MIPREKGKRERETDDRSFPADKMKIHLIPAMLSTFPFLDEGGGRGSVFSSGDGRNTRDSNLTATPPPIGGFAFAR